MIIVGDNIIDTSRYICIDQLTTHESFLSVKDFSVIY